MGQRDWHVGGTVAAMAAKSLGRIGDKRAVEPLIEALKDEDSTIVSEAARALGKIGDKRAVEALTEALKHKDSHVQVAAVEALKTLRVTNNGD